MVTLYFKLVFDNEDERLCKGLKLKYTSEDHETKSGNILIFKTNVL